jgi:hypothetical protein
MRESGIGMYLILIPIIPARSNKRYSLRGFPIVNNNFTTLEIAYSFLYPEDYDHRFFNQEIVDYFGSPTLVHPRPRPTRVSMRSPTSPRRTGRIGRSYLSRYV